MIIIDNLAQLPEDADLAENEADAAKIAGILETYEFTKTARRYYVVAWICPDCGEKSDKRGKCKKCLPF